MRAIFPNNPAGININFRISTSLYLPNIRFVDYWVPRSILLLFTVRLPLLQLAYVRYMKVHNTKQQLQGFPIFRRGAKWSRRGLYTNQIPAGWNTYRPQDQIVTPNTKWQPRCTYPKTGAATWLNWWGVWKCTKEHRKSTSRSHKLPQKGIDWGNPQSADCRSTFLRQCQIWTAISGQTEQCRLEKTQGAPATALDSGCSLSVVQEGVAWIDSTSPQ